MLIKKLFAIILFSINIIPKAETTLKNRFANIRITAFNEALRIHTIRYTFISSVKCNVEFKAIVTKTNGIAKTINTKVVKVDGSYIGRFALSSGYIEDEAYLTITAQSDTFYCVREFVLYIARNSYQTITTSKTYQRDSALQICQADGYEKRYSEFIRFSFDNRLIRSFPYINVNNLRITYKTSYTKENVIDGKEVWLIIDDVDDNFPLLQDENKVVKISYILKETDTNIYQMELNEKLYYNVQTLLLSRIPKDGFIPTTTIFVPKNSKTSYLKTIYQFKSLGYQALNINVESTNILNKYIGSCSTSKYCVKIDESDNYRNDNEIEVKLK